MTNALDGRPFAKPAVFLMAVLALAACDRSFELGSYNLAGGDPAIRTIPRPEPDARGVISYPNYQMAVARRGDTVTDVAARIGLGSDELARHNGLPADKPLREGELLALPRRVESGGRLDIESIATTAIDNADQGTTTAPAQNQTMVEPIRHRVERGETAYSIARLYNVSVTSLASWNGLGADLAVRENQQLLIPIVESRETSAVDPSKPGTGTTTPTPPSASKPLPEEVETATLPPSPELDQFKSDDSSRKFLTPVQGKIIQKYSGKKGGNEGIDIAATPGTAVKAAEDGEVALISRSVGSNTIVLLRHSDNIYTVYSNVKDVKLKKGQKVKRGQKIGAVAEGDPSHLHFEVRRGTESVDPAPYL